ncbi:HAD family hydrolase [Leptothrix discophora]|uniref:HAD-IB family hydrolase n=1 Tax=Leptothrix discophora TaxID=89 RepID=A0ABT9G3B3_LEPDI|nr:HAD-IB family hydrolase [Leptothrix discophora]MDP4300964.1 HAD-IB family hydrolase [Leptothrix discophora]
MNPAPPALPTPAERRHLCLFDLDGTLLPIDSDHAFGEFMVAIGWADGDEFRRRNDEFYAHYQAGTLDLPTYIDFATSAWRHRPLAEAEAAHARYMAEVIEPQMLPAARDLVRYHQQRGDLVAIVTATNAFVTTPIARAFGVEHLLAVDLERGASGDWLGRIRGTPTFREGKVVRVHDWLAAQGLTPGDFASVSVYSDSPNDLALLEIATDPVATNPSPALEAIAVTRGWRILRLFP